MRGAAGVALLLLSLGCAACAQVLPGKALDEAAAPGANFDKAEFRIWYPEKAGSLRAVLVLVPGSNADGRPDVGDRFWQAFASRNGIALLGCHFADKRHADAFIENYANAAQGSGQALLDALSAFSKRSGHPELATAPLLLWGMSAGGEFNYEFTAWKPERVVAFVVNKGGIYFSALLPEAARRVPGMLFTGAEDLEERQRIIAGLFALNRRAGALWALAPEPKVGHVVGRSQEMAATFFEAVLPLRVGAPAPGPAPVNGGAPPAGPMMNLEERSGVVGELSGRELRPAADSPDPTHLTVWLPTERVARAWQALSRSEPFPP